MFAMPQVYKLITPHFLYTLRMNANARTTLVNQGGIVEVTASFWTSLTVEAHSCVLRRPRHR
jgi:hypothetical protein